jgi:hypothetical protein
MSASAQTPRVRADAGIRPRGHACVHTDVSVLPPGNFKTDATVCPSHGRLSGHRPTVRPSVRPLSSA